MSVIRAIFENGVFKPTEPVNLPERSSVEVRVVGKPPLANENGRDAQRKELFDILSRDYDTGQTDAAARHDEHQP
jgi:predicted DNA-binding antitoxin AbrB/MazE fold protein